ncbi:MAG TPA: MBL fold metallo-hydrolase [Patescibacteria group bacterium]|nr:MBL fold metallo-hydrolase [Patescibacteria group bacterium]
MKKIFFITFFALFVFTTLFFYQYQKFHDDKLHIVFCDVGQGDGILITTPSGKQILFDAGPDQAIVDCLSNHMPFWDRTIEVALLSHPHTDHFMGYYYVFERYKIDQFATENLQNNTDSFVGLMEKIQKKQVPMRYVVAGDRWKVGEVTVATVAPTDAFITSKNPDRFITNSAESASLAVLVSYKDFSVLLTGDAPLEEMKEIVVSGLDVLQIPHHGSTTGLDEHVIKKLLPQLAVISVGADNRYGHPKKEILELLQQFGIQTLRTDLKGDIEFISNGHEVIFR